MIDIPVDLAVIDVANLNVAVRPYLHSNLGAVAEHDQPSAQIFQAQKRALLHRTPVVI
jgi:hypothetical protein